MFKFSLLLVPLAILAFIGAYFLMGDLKRDNTLSKAPRINGKALDTYEDRERTLGGSMPQVPV